MNSVVLPSPRSFRATLRRLWGVVLAVAVAGTVVGFFAGERTQTSSDVAPTEASVTLAVADGADLAGSSIAPRISLPSVSLDLVWLQSDEFLEQLRELDEDASVTASSDGVLGIVIFKTTQSSAADSRSALDAAIGIYADYRARAAEDRLSTRIAALDTHIDELESALSTGQDAEAASATLADARAERRELEGQRARLDAVVEEVARTTSEAATATERRRSYLFLGAVGGLLCGLGIVVVATIFDRRLRTRNDVESIAGEHSWLGTTPTGADSGSVAIAAALSFGAGTSDRLRLLSIDDNVSVAEVVASIRPALDRLVAVGRRDVELVDGGRLDRASEIFTVDDGTPNVLVVALGRTDESTLAGAVDQLQRFRLPFAGVIASTLETTGRPPSRAIE